MRGICKFCKEERELMITIGMCWLCWDYLTKRSMRIGRDLMIENKIIDGEKE